MQLCVDSRYASPYALSVFVALRVKQLEFALRTIDLYGGEHQSIDYATTSLTARVPTLAYGNFALSESSAITEYLEERFPKNPLYPHDVQDRARARQVQAWLRSDLLSLRAERPTEVIFYQSKEAPLSESAAVDAEKLTRVGESMMADGRQYLFQTWTIADVDMALMLNRLVLHGDDVPGELKEYAERQWAHSAVREWLSMPRPSLD